MADKSLNQKENNNLSDKDKEKVEEVMHVILRDINLLAASNHLAKRRALEKIENIIFGVIPPHPEHILKIIFQNLYKPVLKLFDDSMDCTRELSVKLVIKFCCHITEPEEFLPYIVPVMQQRITSENNHESTEEIRLLLVESLSKLVDICSDKIGVFIDEIILILVKTLEDPYSEVRKASCSCVCKLAATCPERFYQQGESLIAPLLKSLSHQHNKVRSAVLQTIGITVMSTSGKSVDDVFTHIAQRTFDSSSPVRLMVVEVVGKWLIELRDRYSFFAKLIPLLLSGLCDEMPEIRSASLEYFNKAGMLYEEENEEDLKEKKDYQVVKSFESFLTYKRPRLGCRVLVQQNFSKILPALIHDLTDWSVETRIKAASLLYHLVFYCEDHITMSMELLSNGLYSASHDDEKEVVYQTTRVAELVGKFVEPPVYCKLILKHLESICNSTPKQISGTLLILASYIKGAIPQQIKGELQNISSTIEKTDISSSVDKGVQLQLLACFEAFISKEVIEISTVSCNLFKMILNIIALASNSQVKTEAENQIVCLGKTLHLESHFELFRIYGEEILQFLKKSSAEWSSQSSDCYTYVSLLSQSGPSLFYLLDTSIPIFIQCCDVTKDAEMRQRFFTLMAQLVVNSSLTEEVIRKFQDHMDLIIKDAILPNCIWRAGRTAAAVRSVAMSFLWALLQANILCGNELKKVFNDLQMQIIACLDDHNETTRLVTMKVLLKMLKVCKGEVQVLQLHAIYPEFLKRMDDASDSIRIVTSKTASAYFDCLPEDYDRHFFKAHLEYIYKTLLIHMDDRNESIQKATLACLKDGACKHPLLLKQLVEDVILKHRTKQYCEELLQHCAELERKTIE